MKEIKIEHYVMLLILIISLLTLLIVNDLTGKQIVEIKQSESYVFCNAGQLIGDANSDGVITPSDADIIIDASFGRLKTISTCCLDVNKDGRVTSQDAQELTNMLYKGQQSKEKCWITISVFH